MQAERRNLLQAHSCAARGVACLLSRALQASMANVDSKAALLVYLRDDDRWQQQLVSRLIEEMERCGGAGYGGAFAKSTPLHFC